MLQSKVICQVILMTGSPEFQEALWWLSAVDIILLFPCLALSARQCKAKIVATVLENVTADETALCIDISLAQASVRNQIQRCQASGASVAAEHNVEQEWEASHSVILQDGNVDYPVMPLATYIPNSQWAYLEAFTNKTLQVVQCAICSKKYPWVTHAQGSCHLLTKHY